VTGEKVAAFSLLKIKKGN